MLASKETRGFYDAAIHEAIPTDAVEITAEEHAALLEGQSVGKVIEWGDDGFPFVQDAPPPGPPGPEDINVERDRRIDEGVMFAGKLFQSCATDRENISGAAQLAFMAVVGGADAGDLRWSDPNADFQWIATDNSLVPMDAFTVVEFGKVAAQRKSALIYAARALKDAAPIPLDYAADKWWP